MRSELGGESETRRPGRGEASGSGRDREPLTLLHPRGLWRSRIRVLLGVAGWGRSPSVPATAGPARGAPTWTEEVAVGPCGRRALGSALRPWGQAPCAAAAPLRTSALEPWNVGQEGPRALVCPSCPGHTSREGLGGCEDPSPATPGRVSPSPEFPGVLVRQQCLARYWGHLASAGTHVFTLEVASEPCFLCACVDLVD